MRRSLTRYQLAKPASVIGGSDAQSYYFADDAIHDILQLARLVQRVANLNPDAGEIGAGMLASLVSDAREILEEK